MQTRQDVLTCALHINACVDEHVVVGAVEELLQPPAPAAPRRHRTRNRFGEVAIRPWYNDRRFLPDDRPFPVLLQRVDACLDKRRQQRPELHIRVVLQRDIQQFTPASRVCLFAACLFALGIIILNTKSIMFSTKSTICNKKSIICNTKFIDCNANRYLVAAPEY